MLTVFLCCFRSSAVSQASLVPNLSNEVLSRSTYVEDSSSESAESTPEPSISRRSKSTNGTPGQTIAQREDRSIKITPAKQLGKGAITSTRAQEKPQEQTEEETEGNEESLVPSVRNDTADGGDDERLETGDEESEEEQMNEEMVGERVDKAEAAEEEKSGEEDDEEEEEEVLSHPGQLKASSEAASDRVLSDGSQKSRNAKSKTTSSPEMNKDKEDDNSQIKEETSAAEEEEDEEEYEDIEEEEGDVEDEEEQQPMSAIRKEERISNRLKSMFCHTE